MGNYRYQLERYRGRSTRHCCPQCGRKQAFTRYIDTYNNNIYISDNVGMCNRIDKCGYHYTPNQYFTDNPWKRDRECRSVGIHRKTDRPTITTKPAYQPTPSTVPCTIPWWFMERTLPTDCDYKRWLRHTFGSATAQRLIRDYYIEGNTGDDFVDSVAEATAMTTGAEAEQRRGTQGSPQSRQATKTQSA